jgi:hypothetical protein
MSNYEWRKLAGILLRGLQTTGFDDDQGDGDDQE